MKHENNVVEFTTKLGKHKDQPRIWAEGLRLANGGIVPGTKYSPDIDIQSGAVIFKFDKSNGDYVVKKRDRNGRVLPIVDFRTDELYDLFEDNELLHVLIKDGDLIVTSHFLNDAKVRRETRLKRKLKNNQPLEVVSLFHGTGVLDKAMHSGFRKSKVASFVSVVNEVEGAYLDNSLDRNKELFSSRTVLLNMQIEHIRPNSLGEKDAVFAGIPCTASCNQGRARKKNKNPKPEADLKAGAMFLYFLNIVRDVNPSLILIENVTNYANDASMMVIRTVLASLGFTLEERNFHGNDFGALEARERFVCFAYSSGLDLSDVLSKVKSHYQKPETLSEVLEDIPLNSPLWKTFDYLHAKEKRDAEKGNSFKQQLLTGEECKIGVSGRGYQKARSSEPRILHPTNPALSRLLTLKENCAVKTVPFELIDGNSLTRGHEMLGQGVIFAVFEAIAFQIGTELNNLYSEPGDLRIAA